MRSIRAILGAGAIFCAASLPTFGVTVLFEDALNVDGAITGNTLVGSGFTFGSFTVSVSGAGSHFVGLFVDYEIDEAINTFFNEYGSTAGAALAGQSWEIDEPGWTFGDIFSNVNNSLLDNMNGVPEGAPDDVSMAFGWNFTLLAGETATIQFLLTDKVDKADNYAFYLQQTDTDSKQSVYFASSLSKGDELPEAGSTLILLVSGLLGIGLFRNQLRKS